MPANSRIVHASLLALALLALAPLSAQTAIWTGAASTNDWFNAANWATPGGVTPITFSGPGYIQNAEVRSGGSVLIAGAAQANSLDVGNGASTPAGGTVTVNGAGATLGINGTLYIGAQVDTGTFNLLQGTVTSPTTILGVHAGSTGTLNVSGANAIFNATGSLSVAHNPGTTGTLTIANGGTINIGSPAGSGTGVLDLNLNGGATATLNLGTGAGAGTLNASAVNFHGTADRLVFNHTDASHTFAPAITGPGSVTKLGTGTTTLTGASTYTGVTTITAGTLALGAANRLADTTAVTVASGAAFTLGGFSDTIGSLAGAGSVTLGSGTLTAGGLNTTTTFSGVISGTGGALVKSGTGTLTLTGNNTYSGTTTIDGGTLAFAGNGSVYTQGTSPGSIVVNSGGTLLFNRNDTFGLFTETPQATVTLNAGSLATNAGAAVYTTLRNLSLNGGELRAAGGYDANIPAFQFKGTVTVGGSSTSLITSTGAANSGIQLGNNLNGGATTFHVPDVTGNAAADLVISASLQNGLLDVAANRASSGLAKTGAGTLELSGINTYSGVTTVSAGILALGHGLSLQNSTLNNVGGTVDFTALTSATFGGLTGASSLALTNASAAAVALTVGENGQSTTYSGALSGSGSLTKTGAGILSLAGTNSYSGLTMVNGGTLHFARTASLYEGNPASWTGANLTVNSGATAAFSIGGPGEFALADIHALIATSTATTGFKSGSVVGFDTTNSPGGALAVQLDNPNNGANAIGLHKLGTGTLTLSAGSTYTGPTTVSGGSLNLGTLSLNGGALTLESGSLIGTGTLTPTSATVNSGTLSLNLAGSTSLQKNGAGSLVLTGTNTYSGGTFVTGGILEFSSLANFGSGPLVLSGSSGIKWAPGNTADIGPLILTSYFQQRTFDTNGNNVSLVLSLGYPDSSPYNGTLYIPGGRHGDLIKTGEGNLTLTANYPYPYPDGRAWGGTITVMAGTLTLGAANTVNGAIFNTDGAGTLSFGSLNEVRLRGLTGAGTINLPANFTLWLNPGIPNSEAGSGGDTEVRFDGRLTGPGALRIGGNDTLFGRFHRHFFNGANDYSGGTYIIPPRLGAEQPNIFIGGTSTAFGTGPIYLNGASVTFVAGVTSIANAFNFTADGRLYVSNAITLTGQLDGSQSPITIQRNYQSTPSWSGPIVILASPNQVTGTMNVSDGGAFEDKIRVSHPEALGLYTYTTSGLPSETTLQNITFDDFSHLSLGGLNGVAPIGNQTSPLALTIGGNNSDSTFTGPAIRGLSFKYDESGGSDDTPYILQPKAVLSSLTKVGTGTFTTRITQEIGNISVQAGTLELAPLAASVGINEFGLGLLQRYYTTGYTATIAADATLRLRGGTVRAGDYITPLPGGSFYDWFELPTHVRPASQEIHIASLSGAGTVRILRNTDGVSQNLTTTFDGGGNFSGSLYAVGNFLQNAGTLTITGTFENPDYTRIGGTLVFGNGGTTGAPASGTNFDNQGALVFNRSNALSLANVISGTGTLTKQGAGTLTLSAANSYTGATTISFGTIKTGHTSALGTGPVAVNAAGAILALNGTALANTVSVTNGGALTGSGGVGALSVSSGGTLSPGNSPGILSAATTTFGPGGNYVWEINNAASPATSAGTRYDLLSITGALNIAATSVSPFTINLTSLLSDNSPGAVINFNSSVNSSYTIATASGGITGFSTDKFSLNTTGFTNAANGGSWSVTTLGNDLNLSFTTSAIPEPSTYALIVGAVTLAGCVLRRRRK